MVGRIFGKAHWHHDEHPIQSNQKSTAEIRRALLEDVLLNVESFLNNRPLCYMREEYEQPVITPNLLLHGQPAHFLEEDGADTDGDELHGMARQLGYLKKCRTTFTNGG